MDNNAAVQNRIRELRTLARPGRPRGYTLEEVAEALETTAKQISRLELNERPMNDRWMDGLAKFFAVPVTELFTGEDEARGGTAPLVGYVGAGEMYYPDPLAGPWEGFDQVEAPPGSEDLFAVRVRGDSMLPVYRNGDLLFFRDRDGVELSRCVGKDCIVQVRNGPAFIKRVEKSQRGKLRLVSYGGLPPVEDPDIEWATPVRWVMRGDQ